MTLPANHAVVVATRIHRRNDPNRASQPVPAALLESLRTFIQRAHEYASAVLVAFDAEDAELARAMSALNDGFVETIGVQPWNAFIPALNALVTAAAMHRLKPECILFQSVEASVSPAELEVLRSQLSDDTLVVGKRLEGHEFKTRPSKLTGTTTPWNTCALWNLSRLALTGFLLVSDGLNGLEGGVEECAVIGLHQKLWPDKSAAKLVDLASGGWDTEFQDEGRRAWHAKKMASKDARAGRQMVALGVEGTVEHLSRSD